jgi:predicted transcriptional regulator
LIFQPCAELKLKKQRKMKELTKAEEQVMQVLWDIKQAFVKEVIEKLPEPKPAYNTISTIIRILEKKEFVGHEAFGKTYRYFPLITKKEYTSFFLKGFVKNYFGNSYKQLVSFFSNESTMSIKEMEEMRALIDEQISELKQENDE